MKEGRYCAKCEEWKVFDEFSKDNRAKGGYQSSCKKCQREYRQVNKEKIFEIHKVYYQANKKEICEREKKYRANNKERLVEYQRDYKKANKKRIVERDKAYRQANQKSIAERMRNYNQENRERNVEYRRVNKKRITEYKQSERGKMSAYKSDLKRRSLKYNVCFTPFERKKIIERDNWTCQKCEIQVHDDKVNNENKCHIDHIIPISKGGNSTPKNLQVLCRTCNLTKKDKVDEQLKLIL